MPTQSEISLNPTSAKGQILTHNGSSRISISAGTNGQILSAQSSASSGLQYTTIASGTAAADLIASSVVTSTSASTIVFSSIDTGVTYTSFRLIFQYATTANSGFGAIRFNDVSVSTSYKQGGFTQYSSTAALFSSGDNILFTGALGGSSDSSVFNASTIDIFPDAYNMTGSRSIYYYGRAAGWNGVASASGDGENTWFVGKNDSITGNLTKITIAVYASTQAFRAGTSAYLYGFKR